MKTMHWRGEHGQMVPLVAAMVLFMMALLAVVADTGFVWMQRRNLQNSADAAALAAAQALPEDEAGATALANDYVDKNISGATATVEFGDRRPNGQPLSVKVTAHKDSQSLFGVSLGFGNLDVGAKAKALVRSAQLPGPGVNPIGVSQSDVNGAGSAPIVLKDPGGGGSTGNYGLVAFCDPDDKKLKCSGASIVCEGVDGGSSGVWDPGTKTETGTKNAIRDCVYGRMTAAKANNCYTLAQVTDSSGKLIDRCNPIIGATKGSLSGYPEFQPTAVILIPVITDATWDPDGRKDVSLVQDASGQRIFAFFAISPTTVETIEGVGPTCSPPPGGSGQCDISGVFIEPLHAAVGASGQPVGDYTDDTVVKVVQLVE